MHMQSWTDYLILYIVGSIFLGFIIGRFVSRGGTEDRRLQRDRREADRWTGEDE